MEKIFDPKKFAARAEDLSLVRFGSLSELVEALSIQESKEIVLRIVCISKQQFEDLLNRLTGLDVSVHSENSVTAVIGAQDKGIVLSTEYGDIAVDGDLLKNYLSGDHNNISFSVGSEDEKLSRLTICLTYVPDYRTLDDDTWRSIMLKADFLLLVIDAFHLLYASQSQFISDFVETVFSPERVAYALYNANEVRPEEYKELEALLRAKIGEDAQVFPVLPESANEKLRAKYFGADSLSFNKLIERLPSEAIEIRSRHIKDVSVFLRNSLRQEALSLKEELEKVKNGNTDTLESFEVDRKTINESKEHVLDNVRLFLENSSAAYYRTSTEQFAKDFKKSLAEDIEKSEDIKKDSRSLPRYITYIWEQFTEEQNRKASLEVEKEVDGLIEMVRLDLRRIARKIPSDSIRDKVSDMLKGSNMVNSFFARRTSGGNGLTDALTIGGLVVGIFGGPIGFAAMGASELIKVFGKKSINDDYKREVIAKANDTIDRNAVIIMQQANKKIQELIRLFTEEISAFYDELTTDIEGSIEAEINRVRDAETNIEKIDGLLAEI